MTEIILERHSKEKMNKSKRKFTFGLLGAAAVPAWAQFSLPNLGSLGLGSNTTGGGDPRKIEADLKGIIETTSIAVSKLAAAIGLSETSAKAKKIADDIKTGNVGLSDSTSIVSEHSAAVRAEMEKNQREGKKLDAASGALASEALLPAIKAFPLWSSVVSDVKSLDSSALVSSAALIYAVSKAPAAAKSTFDMSHAAIAYLSFSGVDTTAVKKAAESGLKF